MMNPGIFIFDLDSTLADISHRLHYISADPKDWNGFFAACVDDTPIHAWATTFRLLGFRGAEVMIFTGRSEAVRAQTQQWLFANVGFSLKADHLLMRKVGDRRPDVVVKQEMLASLPQEQRIRIVAAFEDRARVVNMWRDNGIPCAQVGPGGY